MNPSNSSFIDDCKVKIIDLANDDLLSFIESKSWRGHAININKRIDRPGISNDKSSEVSYSSIRRLCTGESPIEYRTAKLICPYIWDKWHPDRAADYLVITKPSKRAQHIRAFTDAESVAVSSAALATVSVEPPPASEELAGRRLLIEDHIDNSIRNFASRSYVYDALSEFMVDPDHQSGYFCLVGYPGDGKTAIAGNYVRKENGDGVYHFVIKEKFSNIAFFQENICHHLLSYAAKHQCAVDPPWDGAWKDNTYLIKLLNALSNKLLQPQNLQLVVVVDAPSMK